MERGVPRVAEPDIYEALAFSMAAKCKTVVLAYLALPTPNKAALLLGVVSVFEKLSIENTTILAVPAEVQVNIQNRRLARIF